MRSWEEIAERRNCGAARKEGLQKDLRLDGGRRRTWGVLRSEEECGGIRDEMGVRNWGASRSKEELGGPRGEELKGD